METGAPLIIPQKIIHKKRDGRELNSEEIKFFVRSLVTGEMQESQVAALAMAIFFRGMSRSELRTLTHEMTHSGKTIDWLDMNLSGPILDKHSSGGIGDKVSLILVPLLAACGAFVPKVSGGSLAHTGGTLDKVESIPGYNARPPIEKFRQVVATVGCAMTGQTAEITPADKILYAIRNITATVDSVPLITSSILCKHLAMGLDGLILDIKHGTGALMTQLKDAVNLAEHLVAVACDAGLPTVAVLTDMNQALGWNVGNALEIREAVEFMQGKNQETRLLEVVITLASELLVLGKLATTPTEARKLAVEKLQQGAACERFAKMITAQGGPVDFIENYQIHLAAAPQQLPVFANKPGYVTHIDGRILGLALAELGGARTKMMNTIDYAVGLEHVLHLGERVDEKTPLLILHARSVYKIEGVATLLRDAFTISDEPLTTVMPVIYKKIG